MDKSPYFNIVLRRGSGKYLAGIWDNHAHWTDDIDQAMRMWSAQGAAIIASALPVKVNAVGYQENRGTLQ